MVEEKRILLDWNGMRRIKHLYALAHNIFIVCTPVLLTTRFATLGPHFILYNYSSQDVIITWSFLADTSEEVFWFQQEIHGLNLVITPISLTRNEYRLVSKSRIVLISYYPLSTVPTLSWIERFRLGIDLYDELDKIPFMVKINSIFKTLIISTADGQKVVTLENPGEQIIKKDVLDEMYYILEIFDYDFVGRPASEW
jgi:hypothetical protein